MSLKNYYNAFISGFFSVFFCASTLPPKKDEKSINDMIKKGQSMDKKMLEEDYSNIFGDLVKSYQKMI